MRRPLARILPAALVAAFAASAGAQERLPIFDTHLHYSQPAWSEYPPADVIQRLDAAGVPRALVSSSPDDGSLRLAAADPGRFVPVLRPYRERFGPSDWLDDPGVVDYLAERLDRRAYPGIGEFHVYADDAARRPALARMVALAVARGIFLHIHSAAGPVERLFALDPRVKVLWAHAGMSEGPKAVGALLERFENLWTELSFRAGSVAPDGKLDPEWRALIERHAGRFMIGTDTFVNGRLASYGELVDEHRRWLDQLPRPLAEAIAFRNAARLFGGGRGAFPD